MKPRSLSVDRGAQTLEIAWTDGHLSLFGLDALRKSCPCAGCVGGHANMGQLPDPALFHAPPERQWDAVRLVPQGHYALRIVWDDGHDAGIYTWTRLRAMCPCADCVGAEST